MSSLGVYTASDRRLLGEVYQVAGGPVAGGGGLVRMVSSIMTARNMTDLAELDGWSNGYLTFGLTGPTKDRPK